MNYVVSFIDTYDFTETLRYKFLYYPKGLTWRELQQKFDPGFQYDNLKFYSLGSEILRN